MGYGVFLRSGNQIGVRCPLYKLILVPSSDSSVEHTLIQSLHGSLLEDALASLALPFHIGLQLVHFGDAVGVPRDASLNIVLEVTNAVLMAEDSLNTPALNFTIRVLSHTDTDTRRNRVTVDQNIRTPLLEVVE